MSGGQFMIVCIVAMVMIGSILKARYQAHHGDLESRSERRERLRGGPQRLEQSPDTQGLQNEIRTLKDRIQVLERIATENNSADDLNRQIEELRNR